MCCGKIFLSPQSWHKVPGGSILIFADTQIPLQHIVGSDKGSPYAKISWIRQAVSIQYQLVMERHMDTEP